MAVPHWRRLIENHQGLMRCDHSLMFFSTGQMPVGHVSVLFLPSSTSVREWPIDTSLADMHERLLDRSIYI